MVGKNHAVMFACMTIAAHIQNQKITHLTQRKMEMKPEKVVLYSMRFFFRFLFIYKSSWARVYDVVGMVVGCINKMSEGGRAAWIKLQGKLLNGNSANTHWNLLSINTKGGPHFDEMYSKIPGQSNISIKK